MLIVCTECKNSVSSFAEACPHCGYPIKIGYSDDEKKRLASDVNTPPEVLEDLANSFTGVQVLVAGNPSTPPAVLEKLWHDPIRQTRKAVVANPSISHRLRMEIIGSGDKEMIEAFVDGPGASEGYLVQLARNEKVDPELLDRLACRGFADVDWSIARNPNTKWSTLRKLLVNTDASVVEAICRHKNLDENQFAEMVPSMDVELRRAIARTTLSEKIAGLLADDEDEFVRMAIAGGVSMKDPQAARKLAGDESLRVVEAVVTNPYVPLELLKEFAREASPATASKMLHARWDKDRRWEIEEALRDNRNPVVRMWVAEYRRKEAKRYTFW